MSIIAVHRVDAHESENRHDVPKHLVGGQID